MQDILIILAMVLVVLLALIKMEVFRIPELKLPKIPKMNSKISSGKVNRLIFETAESHGKSNEEVVAVLRQVLDVPNTYNLLELEEFVFIMAVRMVDFYYSNNAVYNKVTAMMLEDNSVRLDKLTARVEKLEPKRDLFVMPESVANPSKGMLQVMQEYERELKRKQELASQEKAMQEKAMQEKTIEPQPHLFSPSEELGGYAREHMGITNDFVPDA